jgi:hypothetical protein
MPTHGLTDDEFDRIGKGHEAELKAARVALARTQAEHLTFSFHGVLYQKRKCARRLPWQQRRCYRCLPLGRRLILWGDTGHRQLADLHAGGRFSPKRTLSMPRGFFTKPNWFGHSGRLALLPSVT